MTLLVLWIFGLLVGLNAGWYGRGWFERRMARKWAEAEDFVKTHMSHLS